MSRTSLGLAVVVTGALVSPPPVSAESINFLGVGRHAAVSATLRVGTTTYNRNVYAGELNWEWLGTPPAGFAESFYTYCIDLVNYLRDPQTVTVTSSNGFTNGVANGGAKAAWLFNTYAPTIRASGTGTQAAALQVAIWEAMYDTTQGLGSGNFRLSNTNGVSTQANQYLAALYSVPGSYHTSVATVLAASQGQDQLTVDEPSTLAVFGTGLLLLTAFIRRKASTIPR